MPADWLRRLQRMRPKLPPDPTVRDFYRQRAALGGILGRKADGEPAWLTLWRGFDKLAIVRQSAETGRKCG